MDFIRIGGAARPKSPVEESMQARKLSLQAPCNLAGSNTNLTRNFGLINEFFSKLRSLYYKLFSRFKKFKVVSFKII